MNKIHSLVGPGQTKMGSFCRHMLSSVNAFYVILSMFRDYPFSVVSLMYELCQHTD